MNQQTIQLYNQDSHLRTFQAKVLTCIEQQQLNSNKEKVYIVTLDSTAFFPEGGGQACDKGLLLGASVLDVKEDDGIIYHTLSAPLNIGEVVTGTIDWERRFDFMQQHTAEHIISGLVHKYFGYDNVGFHLGSEIVTIDFNGNLTEENLRMIEIKANEAVYENLPVEVTYPSGEELASLDYRSKKELTGDIRIVSIPGFDTCACCAPHVNLTGEIGLIKITSCQKYKGGVRITLLSGTRALSDYNKKEKSVGDISVLLSAKPEEIFDAVKRQKEENLSLKGQLVAMQNQLLSFKADVLKINSGVSDFNTGSFSVDSVISKDANSIYIVDNEVPSSLLRNYGNLLVERFSGLCAVFTSADNISYKYILSSKSIDVRPFSTKLNETFNGKGGGSKEMVQGSLTGDKASLKRIMDELFLKLPIC